MAYEKVTYERDGERARVVWIQEMVAVGRGREMMLSAMRRAEWGEWVQLQVGEDNKRARAAYRAMGLQEVDRTRTCFEPEEGARVVGMEGQVGEVRVKCEEYVGRRAGRAGRRAGRREVRHGGREEMRGAVWQEVVGLVRWSHGRARGVENGGA